MFHVHPQAGGLVGLVKGSAGPRAPAMRLEPGGQHVLIMDVAECVL